MSQNSCVLAVFNVSKIQYSLYTVLYHKNTYERLQSRFYDQVIVHNNELGKQ